MADYYTTARHTIPPVIVVGIEAEVDEIGFSYETGGVNESGSRFAGYLSEKLFPYLEKTYSLAPFRAYIGHSYGADYSDYLLKEHPSWFGGYALIAPEEPAYRLEYGPLLERAPKPLAYYLASAEGDLQRRRDHADRIAAQFGKLESSSARFKHDVFAGADHLTSVPQAVPAALEFLFSGYKDLEYRDADGDLSRWFENTDRRIQSVYGFGIRVDSVNAAYFAGLAADHRDLRALETFERFFMTNEADASVFFNAAQQHYALGDLAGAERLYRRSIERSKSTRQPDFTLMSYRTLALRVDSEGRHDPERAWATLTEAFGASADVAYKYFFGIVSARHGYRVDDGIRYLKEFETERNRSSFGMLYKLDGVYVLLAKCELLKGDKDAARAYVERALRANPANEDAKALKIGL